MIDTHAHINHERLESFLPEIINSLNEKKLKCIICPSYDKKSANKALEFSQKYEKVFGALAIHPTESQFYDEEFEHFLTKNLSDKKIVALGEYGLDYHFLPFDKDTQIEVFLKQLNIAKKQKIQSIFHVRDAFDDFLPLLKQNLGGFCGGVVHCYDSSLENAKKILDLGLMISFTGILTFKQREELREVFKYVPNDRFMLETDSPYLAPVPFRGQVCIPMMVEEVYKLSATLKNLKIEELKELLEKNAKTFFKKLVI
ncbi:MAG: TatD family hydrolase [Clostridia bacterium]|nr:TatD family hydrolase [Clostridia bacterium]